jgi:6-phosphogluconolactonase/glucosamine-6-phosphate isomerase/deaminase
MGQLRFYKVTDSEIIAGRIVRSIKLNLDNGRNVIWLISGGSVVPIACAAAELLKKTTVLHLTVGQIDERFGVPGHPDSNWRQLESAGFNLPRAARRPVLAGKGIEQTAKDYDRFISGAFSSGSYVIGLLGIGADGHTAGILPGSAALSSDNYFDYYASSDFERITLTGKGLLLLDEAVVYAAGASKKRALENLYKKIDPSEQPAQLLKQIARTEVYNDEVGGSV